MDAAARIAQRLIDKGWPADMAAAKALKAEVEAAKAEAEHEAWLKRVDAMAVKLRFLVRSKSLGAAKQRAAIIELMKGICDGSD